jgi:hypothetical protein
VVLFLVEYGYGKEDFLILGSFCSYVSLKLTKYNIRSNVSVKAKLYFIRFEAFEM